MILIHVSHRSAVFCALGLLAAAALAPARVLAQVPQPAVPDLYERSGLMSRIEPIQPVLPHDRDRDTFFDTRWANYPQVLPHVNCYKHNGIYGLPWGGACVSCYRPFFQGSPGQSSLGPGCMPTHKWSRWWDNFLHPFKPVGSYYAGGCYVPIYDLDPLVTGPGPFPWPHFNKPPAGG